MPRPDKGAGREDKIAAIGIRVRRWVTLHGIAINVDPDLEHYSGIVPCGITDQGVTSLADLGVDASMAEVDAELRRAFEPLFGARGTYSVGSTRETGERRPDVVARQHAGDTGAERAAVAGGDHGIHHRVVAEKTASTERSLPVPDPAGKAAA